jgi:hypothetical protein
VRVTALGFVWALPTTAVGVLVGILTFQRPRVLDGLLVFDRGPRGLSWALANINRPAMTVGFVIVSAVTVEGRLLEHERAHVRQAMVLGPFFIPAYLLLAIPFGYRRHPMERAARRAAGEPD